MAYDKFKLRDLREKFGIDNQLVGFLPSDLRKIEVSPQLLADLSDLETPKVPYFYFQAGGVPQYKKVKDPKGDPTAQLLEAFLIAQEKNNNNKILYGCTVYGREWEFYIMEKRTYCISKAYNCTDNEDLMQIIAILRKFKEILENKLLD
jgi:hypothetical protein